ARPLLARSRRRLGAHGRVLHRDGVSQRGTSSALSTTLAERRLADLETVFAALAHEQRRHILLTLQFRGSEMTTGDIAKRFACSWPTTTRHLGVLRDAGLVTIEARGRERIYRLQGERLLGVVGDWLRWFEQSDPGPQAPKRGK